jgi:hypothetical protein
VSRGVLEEVRQHKQIMGRLIARAQRLKSELEEILNDDADMQVAGVGLGVGGVGVAWGVGAWRHGGVGWAGRYALPVNELARRCFVHESPCCPLLIPDLPCP